MSKSTYWAILTSILLGACHRPQSYVEAEGDAECKGSCSGHEAGWRWAQHRQISDPAQCRGRSESFVEGCEAYARDGS
jgi:hypothetical protein